MKTRHILLLLPLLSSCADRPIEKTKPALQAELPRAYLPLNRKIDILFVIDNSGSMGQEQTNLAARFPDFIDRLATLPGGLPDVHIGVVSSDLGAGPYSLQSCETANGDRGALLNTSRIPGCTPPTGRFISDNETPSGRVKNYTGSLSDAFSCIAKIGIEGCGFEQHLESMKRALDGSTTENAGFLREEAYLAVIFIADEDDCSAKAPGALFDPAQQDASTVLGGLTSFRCFDQGVTCNPQIDRSIPGPRQNCVSNEASPYLEPVQKYVDFLVDLKRGNKSKVIVGSVIGNPGPVEVGVDSNGNPELSPSCSSNNGTAVPGIRLAQLTSAFGSNGAVVSICQNDFTPALQRLGDIIIENFKSCIGSALVDVGPTGTPVVGSDMHVDCTATEVLDFGTDVATETTLPACTPGGPVPCWQAVVNPVACPTNISPMNLELTVDRGSAAQADVATVLRCYAAP